MRSTALKIIDEEVTVKTRKTVFLSRNPEKPKTVRIIFGKSHSA